MMYIGLDSGAISGAWAAVDHNRRFVACGDIPHDNGDVLTRELWDMLSIVICQQDVTIVLEKVHAMPKQGVSSVFKFGVAYGAIKAVAHRFMREIHNPTPQAWKKFHGLIGTEKDASRVLARSIWPEAQLHLKKHHGRADALLLADYGRSLS